MTQRSLTTHNADDTQQTLICVSDLELGKKLWLPPVMQQQGQSKARLSSSVTVNIVQWPSALGPCGRENLNVEHHLSQHKWLRATAGWDRKQLLSLCQRDGKTSNGAALSLRANHTSQSSISSRTAICRQKLTNFSLRLPLTTLRIHVSSACDFPHFTKPSACTTGWNPQTCLRDGEICRCANGSRTRRRRATSSKNYRRSPTFPHFFLLLFFF